MKRRTFFGTAAAALAPVTAQTQTKPNILWITCEDMSPMLGCYGDQYASSPNLDKFSERIGESPMAPVTRRATGFEVGALLGWMSGRVLGQYDQPVGLKVRKTRAKAATKRSRMPVMPIDSWAMACRLA